MPQQVLFWILRTNKILFIRPLFQLNVLAFKGMLCAAITERYGVNGK